MNIDRLALKNSKRFRWGDNFIDSLRQVSRMHRIDSDTVY
ncbi:hypothetical protein Dda3937_03957 [Dickeya dadantii 3937]|uniref:Uncharacterized protein n=1 Tax=Dickeya dadantii (strain 3937) TaxID=198628 RepID=E0SIQ9_DICD3|nr:hypothetical protein Dda3937_03957 [Dickeya dadantii 3937]